MTKFVPFVVDEKALQDLEAWLLEQPYKFAAPVVQWLGALQRKAQTAETGKEPQDQNDERLDPSV